MRSQTSLPLFEMKRKGLHRRNFLSLFFAIFAELSNVNSKQLKIIGGQDATHGQFPYQVGLRGDPYQNPLFQMAVPLKLCISDPILVKPKCV